MEERIKELSTKKNFTTEEKAEIRQMCADAGIEVKFGGRCLNCYTDAILLLRNHYGITNAVREDSKYVYLRDFPMRWNGILIDGTTPDETVEEFVKFFPQFFKLKEDGDR